MLPDSDLPDAVVSQQWFYRPGFSLRGILPDFGHDRTEALLGSDGALLPPSVTPDSVARRLAYALVRRMSLEQQVGQLLMPAFEHDTRGRPVTELTDEVKETMERLRPGGVLLFGVNLQTVEQTVSFVRELQGISSVPLLVGVDQEGGPVSRLNASGRIPATELPSAEAIGSTGDPSFAGAIGRIMGRELRSLGITMNMAPVADVLTRSDNPVIAGRSFGSEPEQVADMVSRMVHGIQSQGVLSVVKHFPGHGDSEGDSHYETVVVSHPRERLEQVELVPFVAAMDAQVAGIMSAHITLPEIAGDTPATTSHTVLTELLREDLGYDGLIVTDSLNMEAVAGRYNGGELAVAAVQAGADLLLQPIDPAAAFEAILTAVRGGRLTPQRIERSVVRIMETKFRAGLLPGPYSAGYTALPWDVTLPWDDYEQGGHTNDPYRVLGKEEHQRVIQQLNEANK